MSIPRRIYLLADGAGHSAVVIAENPDSAKQLVWFADWQSRSTEVHLLGVSRDGVPAGRIGQLDHTPDALLDALRKAGQGPPAVPEGPDPDPRVDLEADVRRRQAGRGPGGVA